MSKNVKEIKKGCKKMYLTVQNVTCVINKKINQKYSKIQNVSIDTVKIVLAIKNYKKTVTSPCLDAIRRSTWR